MKKNLLALFVLSAMMYSASAQDTYIKDAVVVKVNPNTLFYNGGSVSVTTDAKGGTTEKIINEGNIQIQGGFTNENTNGKNFVNRFVNSDSYGQLKIKDGTTVTGRAAIERSIPDLNNDEYVISLPFKNVTAKEVINSITGGDFFKGNCLINTNCSNRYLQSLFFWDVRESEYDAVDNNFMLDPKYRYLLNLRNGTAVDQVLNGKSAPIMFAGIPNNDNVTHSLKSGLKGETFDFANQAWKDWKNKINNYNETYNSYLGNQTGTKNDNSLIFGKNQHRLSNPFTSNLDLSDVSASNSWIRFIGISGSAPTEVYQNSIRFRVTKIANDFTIKWNGQTGNTTSVTSPVSAYLSYNSASTPNYFWTGNPQALLVKPYESFYIDYYAINSSGNNNSRIVEAEVNLNDDHKTFDYDFSNRPANGNGFPNGTFNRSTLEPDNRLQSLLNNESLKKKGLVTDFDFTQVEIFLSKNNKFEGAAAYLLNANFMESGSSTAANTSTNSIFLYEESKDGEVINTAQTLSNSFNSIDYIGKPLRLGFYNLVNGEQYSINLNLYEYSILNQVEKLNLGKYYLLDKETNKVEEINADTQINFVANDKINDRFEFYWNELPKTLSTDDLNTKNVTFLYDNNDYQYVRFEKTNTTADITIFDLTGRQISYKTNISTSSDYKLDLPSISGVFIVKIVYKDGKVVTKKTINN